MPKAIIKREISYITEYGKPVKCIEFESGVKRWKVYQEEEWFPVQKWWIDMKFRKNQLRRF